MYWKDWDVSRQFSSNLPEFVYKSRVIEIGQWGCPTVWSQSFQFGKQTLWGCLNAGLIHRFRFPLIPMLYPYPQASILIVTNGILNLLALCTSRGARNISLLQSLYQSNSRAIWINILFAVKLILILQLWRTPFMKNSKYCGRKECTV